MLLMVELFIGLRAVIVQRRMSPAPVVERFDVEEQVRPRLVTGTIHTVMDQLAFQRAEEALHRLSWPNNTSVRRSAIENQLTLWVIARKASDGWNG